jgi:aspartyl-tRNA(Asn)/glutamyl-tRNA(Gln) amidotransferase subunit A
MTNPSPLSSQNLHDLSMHELALALKNKHVSSVELSTHFLKRSRAHAQLGAYVDLQEEATLAQARAADARIAKGTAGALEGVPIAHKDVFVTRDFCTTAGSRMLKGYKSPFDATVVAKLGSGVQGSAPGAGMVCLGKLNCDEFAMGSSNENTAIAAVGHANVVPVRNPWDVQRIPGGSSGGSAAAVAARLAPAATGTDTGGSIRQPASFCGITGIKPTYGRASRYGMVAFASSLDQAGPMARSAQDCALLLSAMCGPDLDRDSTSLDMPTEDFSLKLNDSLAGLRIGVPKEWMAYTGWPTSASRHVDGLHSDVAVPIYAALDKFEQLGATIVEISLPRTDLAIPVYYIIAPAEASSNLSRFDGVKFGHRAAHYTDLADMYKKTRAQGFGDEVKRRIMIGTYVLSHGYYDAYYLQAQKIRRMIANDFQNAFKACDVIAGPVAPTVAWKIGEKSADPLANYLADIYTLPASLAGLPGMSIPVGFGEGGMPIGMQLISNYFAEARLLNAAHRFQQATDWHACTPQGF